MKEYLHKLEKIESLVSSTKSKRILSRPLKYFIGHSYKFISKLSKQGFLVKSNTFFAENFYLNLPSGLDIFLFQAKTHTSEIRLAKYLMRNLNNTSTFIDVGAHFGYFSLLALKCNSKSIVSFEASAKNYTILKKNIDSKKKKITIKNLAISNDNEPVTVYEFPPLFAENNTIEVAKFKENKWFKNNSPTCFLANATTLDEYLLTNKIAPTFIKIDVEGAELKVLEGATNTLQKLKPTIALEFVLNSDLKNQNKVFTFLISRGYKGYLIDKHGNLEMINDFNSLTKQAISESENVIFK